MKEKLCFSMTTWLPCPSTEKRHQCRDDRCILVSACVLTCEWIRNSIKCAFRGPCCLSRHVSVTTHSDSMTAGLSTATGKQVGHRQHRLSPTHMLHQHPVYPEEMHDKELRRRCQSVQLHYKTHCGCFGEKVQWDDTFDTSPLCVFHARLQHVWWSSGWSGRPKSILRWWNEAEVLCWKQSGQFPRWKKLLPGSMCVLSAGRSGLPTGPHSKCAALQVTVCSYSSMSKGLEINGNQQLGNILTTPGFDAAIVLEILTLCPVLLTLGWPFDAGHNQPAVQM